MAAKKKGPMLSPMRVAAEAERNSARSLFGSARRSNASLSPISVRSNTKLFLNDVSILEAGEEDDETKQTKKKQHTDEKTELGQILDSSILFQYAYLEKLLTACKEEGIAPNDWSSYFSGNSASGAMHNY